MTKDLPGAGVLPRHPGRDRFAVLVYTVDVFVDLATGVYLTAYPVEEFRRSEVWAGALPLLPGQNPAILGVGFLLAGLLVPLARSIADHVAVIGWAGLTLGGVSWGLLAGSFGFAAYNLGGLGSLGLIGAVAFAALHLGALYLTRPHGH